MALSVSQTVALGPILKSGMSVCSLGYPDLIAPIGIIFDMLGEEAGYLKYREDSEAICKRHGLQLRKIPDAESFFGLMGCGLDVYDIVQERGCEKPCDLNKPDNLKYANEYYDIVLDVGTVEHCFNIAQALMNMAGLVKQGGYIIHENPFNSPNHGFYNLNPTFFVDFYEANGFENIQCYLASREGQRIDVPQTQRFKWEEREMNVFCMAQRVSIQSFVFPTQSKYKQLIPVAGVRAEEKEIA